MGFSTLPLGSLKLKLKRRNSCPHPIGKVRSCKFCLRPNQRIAEQKYDSSNREKRTLAAATKRKNDPDYVLMRKYGITKVQRDTVLAEQGGHCAFCPRIEKLEVDHDHDTKRFRGVLCDRHNRGLGFFTLEQLRMAVDYVEGVGKFKPWKVS
jgi:hypothetical protein